MRPVIHGTDEQLQAEIERHDERLRERPQLDQERERCVCEPGRDPPAAVRRAHRCSTSPRGRCRAAQVHPSSRLTSPPAAALGDPSRRLMLVPRAIGRVHPGSRVGEDPARDWIKSGGGVLAIDSPAAESLDDSQTQIGRAGSGRAARQRRADRRNNRGGHHRSKASSRPWAGSRNHSGSGCATSAATGAREPGRWARRIGKTARDRGSRPRASPP